MSSCGKITGISAKVLVSTLVIGGLLSSCHAPIQVEGFDNEAWRSDTNACKLKRASLLTPLLENKKAFLNKKDEHLMTYMGKPDKTLFFARGKKTMIYQVDPGAECTSSIAGKVSRTIRYDINALGRIELIYVLGN